MKVTSVWQKNMWQMTLLSDLLSRPYCQISGNDQSMCSFWYHPQLCSNAYIPMTTPQCARWIHSVYHIVCSMSIYSKGAWICLININNIKACHLCRLEELWCYKTQLVNIPVGISWNAERNWSMFFLSGRSLRWKTTCESYRWLGDPLDTLGCRSMSWNT